MVVGGVCLFASFSTFRLFDLSGSWKVGGTERRRARAGVGGDGKGWVVAGQETEDAAGGLAALRVLASVPPLLGGGGLPAGQGRRKERRARLGW